MEVVLWGNLSQKHDVDTKLSLLKAHFEKEHEVLKPFSQKEMTFLLNYQNTLTCDSYDCWNHNIPTDLYSSVRKEAFRILKKAILKVIYEDKFSKKIIPDELNFMKIVSLMTLNYNYNGTDLHEINNDFQNGNLKEISHYFTFDFNPNKDLCVYATANIIKNKKWVKIWETHPDYQEHVKKAKNLGLTCDVGS